MTERDYIERVCGLVGIVTIPCHIDWRTLVEQSHGLCVELVSLIRATKDPKDLKRLIWALDSATVRYVRRLALAGFGGKPNVRT